MKFLVENDSHGKPSWWLVDDNSELIAWAGDTFGNLESAEKAAHGFRLAARTAAYKAAEAEPSAWHWHAWSGSTCIARSLNQFPTEAAAMVAALDVSERLIDVAGP